MMMLGMIPPLSQAFLKWRLQASLLGIKFLSHVVCTNCYNFIWDIDMCQTSPSFGKPLLNILIKTLLEFSKFDIHVIKFKMLISSIFPTMHYHMTSILCH
jgi:hypothetical protein